MKYSSNILPDNPAVYDLIGASIVDGILSISNGGTATYNFTKNDISKLTSHFRLSLYTDSELSAYSSNVLVFISARTDTGYFNYTCVPTKAPSGIYSAEIELEAADYEYFTITFKAITAISFSLWELCPEAASDDIQTIIEGVEQSLPKLLDDYNVFPFTIGQRESTIALITCRLLNDTDLQGHLLLVYNATQNCTLTIRLKDNGSSELYSPLIYDIKKGRGNIGVPHAYLNRLAGIHNIVVTAQVSVGTLAIATRGLLFTIDGGYLAKRLIDFGADICDISIKQTVADTSPSEIWAIGIDNNEAVVRKREYSESSNASYEPVFVVASDCAEAAIEFNGVWTLRQGATKYTLETDEYPYVFFVDSTGNLYAQYSNSVSSRVLLDTGVSKISVCRGYMSQAHPEQDQGLICAYIKSQEVYYRTYAYSSALNTYIWDYARKLDDVSNASFVNVHRLNDYRIGIATSTPTDNLWSISDRTYVAQSTKPETAKFSLSDVGAYCSVRPANDTTQLSCATSSSDRKTLIATFNRSIMCVDDILDSITISGGATFDDIESVTLVLNVLTVKLKAIATRNVQVTLKPYKFLYSLPNSGQVFIGSFVATFTLPTFSPEQINIRIGSSVTCSLVPILTKQAVTSDTIGMSFNSSASCSMILISTHTISGYADTLAMPINARIVACSMTKVGVLPI